MRSFLVSGLVLLVTISLLPTRAAEAPQPEAPAAVELLEDEVNPLIKQFISDGGGRAFREAQDKYSGVCSMRVTPRQTYSLALAGWKYSITEKPKAGEYRYIRFAWKKSGGNNIMLQLVGEPNGTTINRYVAGAPVTEWANLNIADKIPEQWEIVTRDLCKDFGPFVMTAISLTPLDGKFALFDHIYLGRTVEDLDKVSAGVLNKKPPQKDLSAEELEKLWGQLASSDASQSARARWAMVAAARQSVPFLKERLRGKPTVTEGEKRIAGLIAKLDDDEFDVREAAFEDLAKEGAAASRMLRKALQETTSVEVRQRINRLLKDEDAADGVLSEDQLRLLRVARILEQVDSADAKLLLETLVSESQTNYLREEVKAAVNRFRSQAKP